jgi:hypothetical protein
MPCRAVVSERLTIHQANFGCVRPAQPIRNSCQRHHPPRLFCVAQFARQSPQIVCAAVIPQLDANHDPLHGKCQYSERESRNSPERNPEIKSQKPR